MLILRILDKLATWNSGCWAIGLLVRFRVLRTALLIQPHGEFSWLAISFSGFREHMLKLGIYVHHVEWQRPKNTEELESNEVRDSCIYLQCMRDEALPGQVSSISSDFIARASNAKSIIRSKISSTLPSLLITFQGFTPEAYFARKLGIRLKIPIASLECTMDSSRCIVEPYTGISVNANSSIAVFYKHRDFAPGINSRDFIHTLYERKTANHASPSGSIPSTGRIRIVFIGQCYTDSSLLFNPNSIRTEDIFSALKSLSLSRHKDLEVVMKPHPHERIGSTPLGTRYNDLTLRKIGPDHGAIVMDKDNKFSTLELMKSAEIIITINSQAGLEALALGKEVITLGNAPYTSIGCTHNLDSHLEIESTIDKIITGKRLNNQTTVSKFLDVYFNIYCVQKSIPGLGERLDQIAKCCLK